MTLTQLMLAVTLGVYVPAFVFSSTTQDFEITEPTDLFSTFGAISDFISIVWDLVTLSGLSLDPLLRYGLVILLGFGWTVVGVGLLRGTSAS